MLIFLNIFNASLFVCDLHRERESGLWELNIQALYILLSSFEQQHFSFTRAILINLSLIEFVLQEIVMCV